MDTFGTLQKKLCHKRSKSRTIKKTNIQTPLIPQRQYQKITLIPVML